jgi:hypothetical protein
VAHAVADAMREVYGTRGADPERSPESTP